MLLLDCQTKKNILFVLLMGKLSLSAVKVRLPVILICGVVEPKSMNIHHNLQCRKSLLSFLDKMTAQVTHVNLPHRQKELRELMRNKLHTPFPEYEHASMQNFTSIKGWPKCKWAIQITVSNIKLLLGLYMWDQQIARMQCEKVSSWISILHE